MADTFTEDRRYGLEDLRQIIGILRSGQGCPWDREQTHTSLKACMMEEAQEALDAIDIYARTGAWDNLDKAVKTVYKYILRRFLERVVDGVGLVRIIN